MRRPRRVPKTPVPPAIRRVGHRASPRVGARLRISPPSRARPRATACRPLHARPNRRARAVFRAPQRNGRQGVAPVRARPRRGARCPCGASTALPRVCGEARPTPFGASHAGRFVRQRPRKAASERGGLYHAVINPASSACLADPSRRWPGGRFSAPSLPESTHETPIDRAGTRRRGARLGSDGARLHQVDARTAHKCLVAADRLARFTPATATKITTEHPTSDG